MARLILKSPYLKPGGKKSPGGYLKYIATREGVEMAEDTSHHLPATSDQQKQINTLIKKHPQSRKSHEYEDYLANPTGAMQMRLSVASWNCTVMLPKEMCI